MSYAVDVVQETLDAALEPLLLQQKFKQGGTEMIKASTLQKHLTSAHSHGSWSLGVLIRCNVLQAWCMLL